MAEKIISPGVFTKEIDQSFLPAAIGDIGAAVVGPTLKRPHLQPTVVSSYSEYQQLFGSDFVSGSDSFRYLTDHAAEEYLKNGNKLTVVRITSGSFSSVTNSKAFIGTSGIVSSSDGTFGILVPTASTHIRLGIGNLNRGRSVDYELTASLDYNTKGVNAGVYNTENGSRCAFVLHALTGGPQANSLSRTKKEFI